MENKYKIIPFDEYIKKINKYQGDTVNYYNIFTMLEYPFSSYINEFKYDLETLPSLSLYDNIEISNYYEDNPIKTEIYNEDSYQYTDQEDFYESSESEFEEEVCEKYKNGLKYI